VKGFRERKRERERDYLRTSEFEGKKKKEPEQSGLRFPYLLKLVLLLIMWNLKRHKQRPNKKNLLSLK
jgi:hypothetical protein